MNLADQLDKLTNITAEDEWQRYNKIMREGWKKYVVPELIECAKHHPTPLFNRLMKNQPWVSIGESTKWTSSCTNRHHNQSGIAVSTFHCCSEKYTCRL